MIYHGEQQLIKDENAAFQIAVLSAIGDREDQQDSLGYHLKQNEGLVIVCDGMGGHEGGKIASEIAVQTFLNEYSENYLISNQTDMMIETAKKTDHIISNLTKDKGELLNAGSTMISVIISGKQLMWCSVGDSRAYLMRGGEFVQLSLDHNYHTVLIEKKNAGLITEEEFAMEDKRGEALISFLGIGNLALIDYSETPFEVMKDDKILLMSDGLYKLVSDDEISRILDNFSNIGEAIQALEMKAKKNAKYNHESRDNMTIALIKIK